LQGLFQTYSASKWIEFWAYVNSAATATTTTTTSAATTSGNTAADANSNAEF
jgi:hypothetical protein